MDGGTTTLPAPVRRPIRRWAWRAFATGDGPGSEGLGHTELARATAVERAGSTLPPGAPRRSVDVLVVDDDDNVRTSVAEILQLAGYSTAQASDGLMALEMFEELEVGVLVLDIRMPRLDGFGLLDALEHPPPVILMSAFSKDDDPRSMAAVVYWYLRKPLQPRNLLEAVRRALGRSED